MIIQAYLISKENQINVEVMVCQSLVSFFIVFSKDTYYYPSKVVAVVYLFLPANYFIVFFEVINSSLLLRTLETSLRG